MKKLILTTAFAVYAVLGFSQTPYWSYGFENGAMTDGAGNNDLTQNGVALTTTTDHFGSPNDAVSLGGDLLVGGQTEAGSYSVSFWINDVVNDANQRMVLNDYLSNYGFYIVVLNGYLRAYAKFGSTANGLPPFLPSPASNLPTAIDVADGNWHHVAFTATKSLVGQVRKFDYKLYIDGVVGASATSQMTVSPPNIEGFHGLSASHTFAVGNDATNSSSFNYENTIDDIVFYKEDLSATEIAAIYNAHPPQVVYVDKDATGANDGSSWADAFVSLTDATVYAGIGDEIWVADGIYTPHASSRSIPFTMNPGVSLYGGFNGTETTLSQRDWRANEVVLSGDLSGNDNSNVGYTEATRSDNSYNVVVVSGSNTLIDGVTISGGQANHASNNDYKLGGAIRKDLTVRHLEVRNCIIEKNTAYYNAGIYATFTESGSNSVILENCIFNENLSKGSSAFSITINNATAVGTATVANCLMSNNTATDYPGSQGFAASAGQFSTTSGELTASMINCTVVDNVDNGTHNSLVEAGAIGVRRDAGTLNFSASNNIFNNNSAALSFGRIATNNCPSSMTLSHNIRPDVATPWCSATSTNESSSAATLDANFRPTAGSSSIDAGDNAVAVGTFDIDGTDRVLDGTIDIGAFEYNSNPCSPITQQPVTTAGCIGDDVSFSVGTTGTITSYQWKLDGTNVSGANSATLNLTDIQNNDIGDYTVEVVAACGTVTSSTATLTLSATPTITTQPSDATNCETDDVFISMVASPSGLTYQWQQDGVDVPGETTSSIFIGGIDASDAGNYTVVVSGLGLCPITSDVAVVTVNLAPTITQQPTDQSGCLGDNATFTAAANGATLTQWYKAGNPMASELASTLTLTNLVAGDAAAYKMIAGNSCGAIFSDEVQLNVGSTTTVTLQPVSASQCEGTGAQFISQATGTNISYQWRLDGLDIAGANAQTLNVPTIDQNDAGSYTLEFTGACGTEVSDAAVLEVNEEAAITSSVSDATECAGEDASFTVSATGYNLSYQWSDQSGILSGETSPTLDLTNIQLADAGLYSVAVDGQCGPAVASSGTLTVNVLPVPTITENLGMLETGVFDTYQWYIDGNIQNGETNASIAITVSGDYTVEVTDNGCEGTSSPYNVMTVGIEEQAATIVAAYPNPFTDVVTLEVADFDGQTEVSVIDMTGRTVFTSIETVSNVQLNLEHLSSGTYGLIVRGENGKTAMSRLIKN